MREKIFENRVKEYLSLNGCWFCKFFANSYTKVGVPDILACVNGKFVGIEVKAEKGKPSQLQIHNRDRIRESGGISIILYPEQFENFKNFIQRMIAGDDVHKLQKVFDK